jgi:hypothetical protein
MEDRRPTRRAVLAAGAATAAAAVAGCGRGAASTAARAAGTSSAGATSAAATSAAATTSSPASAGAAASAPAAPATWAVAAAAGESNLVASYAAVIKAHPSVKKTLTPLRAAHSSHLKALKVHPPGKAIAGLSTGQAEALSRLVAAEQKASDTVAALCMTCPAEAAALLGSIAAADASHAVVLQSVSST